MLSNEPRNRSTERAPSAPEPNAGPDASSPLADERLPVPALEGKSWPHSLRDLDETAREVARMADGLGRGIDEAIKPAVTGLLALGIPTQNSCEGHLDHGAPFPNIDIGEQKTLPMIYDKQREYFAERLSSIRVPFMIGISDIGTFGVAALAGRARVTPESIDVLDRGDFRIRHPETWKDICNAHLESLNDCLRRNQTTLAPEESEKRTKTASLYDSVESLVVEYNVGRSADSPPPHPDARVTIAGCREQGFSVSAGRTEMGETVSPELLRERQAEIKRFAEFLFEKHRRLAGEVT